MKKFQINPKVLEEEIDAEKLAIADAKHNIPPSDSKTPGASESKIRMISSESLMETVSKINKSGSYLQRKLAETKIKNEKRIDDTKTAPERFKKEASIIVEKNWIFPVTPGTKYVSIGGMVANNWFLSFLADILGLPVERPANVESTALGAAYLAGLQSGLYASVDEVSALWSSDVVFEPRMSVHKRDTLYAGWKEAVTKVRS